MRSRHLVLVWSTLTLSTNPSAAAPPIVHEAQPNAAAAAPSATEAAAPTLADLVARALANAPALAAIEARHAAAAAREPAAGALPDPMVEVQAELPGFPSWKLGDAEMARVGTMVRQGLFFPGKRKAARAAASADTAVAAAELERGRRELVRELGVLFARLYALDHEQLALATAGDLLDLLVASTSARYGAGSDGLEPMLKAGLRRVRLGEREDDIVAERTGIHASLERWLGSTGRWQEPITSLAEPTLDPGWEAVAAERAADVLIAEAVVAVAARKADVARLERRPNLAAIAGFAYRGELDAVVTLGLALELPAWRAQRQEPLLRAALLEQRAAEMALEDTRAATRAEALTLAAAWTRSDTQVRRYRQAILPQSALLFDAARAGYAVGTVDFATVLDDFDLWLEAQVELARHEALRFATWAAAHELVTAAPSPRHQEAQP